MSNEIQKTLDQDVQGLVARLGQSRKNGTGLMLNAGDVGVLHESLCLGDLFTRPHGEIYKAAKAKMEKQLANEALIRTHGNILRAADLLGISRQKFYQIIRKK